jgi:hypothetical protein
MANLGKGMIGCSTYIPVTMERTKNGSSLFQSKNSHPAYKVSMFCLSSDYGRPQLEGCKDNRNGRNKDVVQKWTVDGKDGWRTLMENKGQCLETNGTTLFFSNCKETKGENFRRWEERALPW